MDISNSSLQQYLLAALLQGLPQLDRQTTTSLGSVIEHFAETNVQRLCQRSFLWKVDLTLYK